MGKPSSREAVVAKLAEWDITLSENELDQLVPSYENLLHWQGILIEMLHQKKLTEGMSMPASEPLTIHCIEKKGGLK